jgi:hypothetical protein
MKTLLTNTFPANQINSQRNNEGSLQIRIDHKQNVHRKRRKRDVKGDLQAWRKEL